MTHDARPAVVTLRMSPQMREALRAAAAAAGCSVNGYAVQVLAAAAGDPARFRAQVPEPIDVRELERDALGYPLRSKERREHSSARSVFMDVMMSQAPDEWVGLVKKYDSEDPGYYVEWMRRRTAAQQPSAAGYGFSAPSP